MKVIACNGSPHHDGVIQQALELMWRRGGWGVVCKGRVSFLIFPLIMEK